MTSGLKKMMSGNKLLLPQGLASTPFDVLKCYMELLKLHLCLYISLSAISGYSLSCNDFSFNTILLGFFVLVLACGAAVLNNIQDKEYDGCFRRTKERCLPQQKITVPHAAIFSASLSGVGLCGLWLFFGTVPFLWGCAALICYNGCYTPLKKRTLTAIIPGALCGILPPLIGWTAGGKPLFTPDIMIIRSVFALWQIPHFFIIILKNRQQASETDGGERYPCFTDIFTLREIKLQVLIWTCLYSLSMFLFSMKRLIDNEMLNLLLSLNASMIPFFVMILLQIIRNHKISIAFAGINLSMLFFMGMVIGSTIFH